MAPRPGKYDAVLPGLPNRPVDDPSRQEKIERTKAEITAPPPDGVFEFRSGLLAERIRDAKAAVEDILAIQGRMASGDDAARLTEAYVGLRATKDLIAGWNSEVSLLIEAHEQLLAESQERQAPGWGKYGVKDNALRLPSGVTVRVHFEPYGKVMDKEAFRLWCVANGYERKLQLWPSSMNDIAKERLLAGEPPPDGVEVFSWTKIALSKAGAKGEE